MRSKPVGDVQTISPRPECQERVRVSLNQLLLTTPGYSATRFPHGKETMTAMTRVITLAEFLKLPDTQPASEFIDGQISQKPMPQGKHSTLQIRLADTINDVGFPQKIAYAFPELRCTFGGRSIVPDVAVFKWERIPFDADGEVANTFELAPDWTIEILSPDQSQTRVTDNIVFCLKHQTRLGWLIDPDEKAVICFQPNQLPEVLRQPQDSLPVPDFLDLRLSVGQVFSWLKLGQRF